MNILVITPVLPYPPNDGDRIRIYNFLKRISRWNKIHLVSFIYKGEEKNIVFLKKMCSSIDVVSITKLDIIFNALKTVFTSTPINIGAYESGEFKDIVDRNIKDKKIDLIYVYRIRCAPYAINRGIPAVIDIVDSMALVNKRREIFENNILRKFYIKIDYPRLLNYEKKLDKDFSAIFINFEDDADFLGLKKVTVIPNGVSGRFFKKNRSNNFIIGFFGNIEYGPNYDAVMFFYENIWKKISESDRNIKMIIVGDRINRLKHIKDGNIEIKSYSDDIDREISSWNVSVVPVRYGAGRQNKILKSWACGVPVVATEFASSGVYGKDRENLLVARSVDDFCRAIYNIKNDSKLKKKIIKGGFKTVRKYFDWEKNLKILDNILRKVKKR